MGRGVVLPPVRPARCDRSREAISLRLDGVLSLFESALLDRHLRRCADCRAFAAGAAAQTQLLRTAELEQPLRPVALPAGRRRPVRRVAAGALTAVASVAAAAAMTLSPGGHSGQGSAVSAAPSRRDRCSGARRRRSQPDPRDPRDRSPPDDAAGVRRRRPRPRPLQHAGLRQGLGQLGSKNRVRRGDGRYGSQPSPSPTAPPARSADRRRPVSTSPRARSRRASPPPRLPDRPPRSRPLGCRS